MKGSSLLQVKEHVSMKNGLDAGEREGHLKEVVASPQPVVDLSRLSLFLLHILATHQPFCPHF